jgi:hypothetical protein
MLRQVHVEASDPLNLYVKKQEVFMAGGFIDG